MLFSSPEAVGSPFNVKRMPAKITRIRHFYNKYIFKFFLILLMLLLLYLNKSVTITRPRSNMASNAHYSNKRF